MVQLGNGADLARLAGGIPRIRRPTRCAPSPRSRSELVAFHTWLQWLADRQLGAAQARARAPACASASISTSPSASRRTARLPGRTANSSCRRRASARRPTISTRPARTGASRRFRRRRSWRAASSPIASRSTPVLRHAGALRIDHAMSLYRLFWIAEGLMAADGVYVRYPFHAMLRALAAVSQARHAIVIGEDLGVVPPGFREVMQQTEIQSYRVFFFEKQRRPFLCRRRTIRARRSPASPPTTSTRSPAGGAGTTSTSATRSAWSEASTSCGCAKRRAHWRRRAARAAGEAGCCRREWGRSCTARRRRRTICRRASPSRFTRCRAHALAALRGAGRGPDRALEQVNIPGTTTEHPNWRRKLAVDLEELPDSPFSAPSPRRCARSGRSRASAGPLVVETGEMPLCRFTGFGDPVGSRRKGWAPGRL